MSKLRLSCLSLFVGLCLSGAAFAQDTYTLGFTGEDTFSGPAGSTVGGSYTCTVAHEGSGPGAQGWSVSLTADNATIVAINDGIADGSTTSGEIFNGGFSKTETTASDAASIGDCAGQAGAVSAVVLSFTMPLVLPPNESSTIATIDVEAEIPAGGGTATVRYANGCKGSGQPVANNITQEGATVEPVLGSLEIALNEAVTCCGGTHLVGFAGGRVQSDAAEDGLMGLGPDCLANEGTIEASGESTGVHAVISTSDASQGVQGWSFSVEAFDDVDIADVTTAGTSGGPVPDGKANGGFEKTEVVNPDAPENGGRRGVVSAVVLSFTMPITLSIPGTESVLLMTVVPTGEAGDDPITGSLKYRDGLKGSGQPVNNVLTVAGSSGDVCNLADASIEVAFLPGPKANVFNRGDANDDGKVNIADPIWTISSLFRQGPPPPCASAADSNDDGGVDLADAVFTIEYRFLGGALPSAPFGESACTAEPEESLDELTCGDSGITPSCE